MALFGSDMVDVTTPDGRRLTVPSQLAAQFPGLQPASLPGPPSPPPGAAQGGPVLPSGGAPVFGGGDAAALAELTPPVPPVSPAAPATASAVLAPAVPVRPAQAAPAQRPPTDAELAKRGVSAGLAATNAAFGGQEAAIQESAAVEADAATQIGAAMAKRDEESQRRLEDSARVAAENQQKLEAAVNERKMNADKLAKMKVSREHDHPVRATIGLILATIGTAMQNQQATLSAAFLGGPAPAPVQNPAIAAFYAAIDRKVAAQMADIEKGRGDLADQDKIIGLMRQVGGDRLAAMDALRDAGLQQAAREIETLKTQLNNPRAKANADLLIADIGQKRAAADNAAADTAYQRITAEQVRKDQKAQHAQSVGLQIRGQNLEQGRWSQDFAERKRQFDIKEANDLEAARLTAKGKGREHLDNAQKDNEERAIADPTTGGWLMQPEGAAMVKQAESHDMTAKRMRDAAQRETDPSKQRAQLARADAEEQRASALRGEASAMPGGTFKVGKGERDNLSKLISAAQTIASGADRIKRLRKEHGERWITTSEGQAAMQAEGVALTMAFKDAWALGVLSASDRELLDKATGGDPSRLTAGDIYSAFGVQGPAARLDALVQGVELRTRNELRGKGYRGEYRVERDKAVNLTPDEEATEKALREPTPLEGAADAERGVVGKAVDALNPKNTAATLWGGESSPQRRREIAAEESGGSPVAGLSVAQGQIINSYVAAYQRNAGSDDPKAQQRAKVAADALLGLAGGTGRPSMSSAVMSELEQRVPELHRQAIERLPPMAQQARRDQEATVMQAQPVGLLVQTAITGDPAAKTELARRAAAGDKEALVGIAAVVNSKGRRQ
jgi:hypothetical protein